jgi:hypothetical protein
MQIGVDTAAAERALDTLTQAAQAADQTLQKLKQTAVDVFNATPRARQIGRVSDFPTLETMTDIDLAAGTPLGQQTMPAITAVRRRQAEIASAATQFMAGPGQATLGAPPPQQFAAFADWMRTQQGRAGNLTLSSDFENRLAGAIARAGTQAAAAGGLPGAGMLGGLMGGVGPGGLALGGTVLGAAGAFLAVTANQAQFQTRQAQVAAATAGGMGARPTGQSAADLERAAGNVGQAFNINTGPANTLLTTLAQMGVQQRQLITNLGSTMAMGRLMGLGEGQMGPVAQLTAGLATRGNMDPQQIARLYQELVTASRGSNVSLTRLVESLQQLQQVAQGARVDVAGLTEAQRLLSRVAPQANIGQLIGGAVGATGTDAIRMGALLGLNAQQFAAAQGQPMQLLRAAAGLVQRVDQGPMGTQVAELMLGQAGLNLSGLNPQQQAAFVALLQRGDITRAMAALPALRTQLAQGALGADAWQQAQAAATAGQTPALQRGRVAFENWLTNIFNAPPNQGTPYQAQPGVPNRFGVAPTQPIGGTVGLPTQLPPGVSLNVTVTGSVTLRDSKGRPLDTGALRATATPQPAGYQTFGPPAPRHH